MRNENIKERYFSDFGYVLNTKDFLSPLIKILSNDYYYHEIIFEYSDSTIDNCIIDGK